MRHSTIFSLLLLIISGILKVNATNKELDLVSKQVHKMETFTTFYGDTIKDLRVGWESYGRLNADKSNVILITHYFTGSSHAAGRYRENDEAPGYWDAIIGSGKAIDTDKYYVISVDSLANISAYDADVVTTGPASINPDTGKAYALDFPIVTMRDFVNVQKAVLDSLGIQSLHAVAGSSMGSMQAIEWTIAYPNMVKRLISVIGSASTDAWTSALLDQWTWPIKLDPNWRGGNYHHLSKDQHPRQGLTYALAMITQIALTPEFFNLTAMQVDNENKRFENNEIQANPIIVDWLLQRAGDRAEKMDANHLIYLVRANQLFVAGMKRSLQESVQDIQAKSLFITAKSDLLLMPYHAELAYNTLKNAGKTTELLYMDGNLGHLQGVAGIAEASDAIKTFLDKD